MTFELLSWLVLLLVGSLFWSFSLICSLSAGWGDNVIVWFLHKQCDISASKVTAIH